MDPYLLIERLCDHIDYLEDPSVLVASLVKWVDEGGCRPALPKDRVDALVYYAPTLDGYLETLDPDTDPV